MIYFLIWDSSSILLLLLFVSVFVVVVPVQVWPVQKKTWKKRRRFFIKSVTATTAITHVPPASFTINNIILILIVINGVTVVVDAGFSVAFSSVISFFYLVLTDRHGPVNYSELHRIRIGLVMITVSRVTVIILIIIHSFYIALFRLCSQADSLRTLAYVILNAEWLYPFHSAYY